MKVILTPDAQSRPATTLEAFLERLDRVQAHGSYWMAKCPAHDDKIRSLSVKRGDKHEVVWRCHAGCSQDAVVKAVGFERAASVLGSTPREEEEQDAPASRKIEAIYPYHDEEGKLLNEVIRFEGKGFRQRHTGPDGTWVWNLDGVRRVHYRLPELRAAHRGSVVYVVEGERDVETLRSQGCLATTTLGGASAWASADHAVLSDQEVVILPDNDDAGERYARDAADSLKGLARGVRIVRLPNLPPKGDVTDFFEAGASVEELLMYVNAVPHLYRKSKTWTAQELANAKNLPIIEGFLAGSLIGRGTVMLIAGRRGIGKTFMTLSLASRISTGDRFGPYETKQGRVLYLSQEMNESAISRRLGKLFNQKQLAEMGDNFVIRCKEPGVDLSTDEGANVVVALVKETKADVVFIDALRDVKGHASEKDNDEMGPVMIRLRDTIAEATNCAVVLIHHMGKAQEDGSHRGGRGASVIEDVPADVMYLVRDKNTDKRVAVLDKTRDMEPQNAFAFDMVTDSETGMLRVDVQSHEASVGDMDDIRMALAKVEDAGGEMSTIELGKLMTWDEPTRARKAAIMEKAGSAVIEKRGGKNWLVVNRRQQPLDEAAA